MQPQQTLGIALTLWKGCFMPSRIEMLKDYRPGLKAAYRERGIIVDASDERLLEMFKDYPPEMTPQNIVAILLARIGYDRTPFLRMAVEKCYGDTQAMKRLADALLGVGEINEQEAEFIRAGGVGELGTPAMPMPHITVQ
jgi:hypothetical protein